MSGGAFDAGPYHFAVDDGYAVLDLPEPLLELAVEDLDARLVTSGHVPELGGAPLASWLLARLEALTEGRGLGFSPGLVEHVDGGVWVVDFVVTRGDAPVGKVQLQAGMIGAGVLGVVAAQEDPAAVVQALGQVVLQAPEEVRACEVRVADPEWLEAPEDYAPPPEEDAVCRFGFDGEAYLGADNVRPRAG